jgi:hypothetical protein
MVRARGNAAALAAKLNGAFVKTVAPAADYIDVECALPLKMDLLRTLTGCADLCTDVEVRLPTLDDLYVHFSGRSIDAGAKENAP